MSDRPRIAIVWRGDQQARHTATAQNSRYYRIFEELAAVGIVAEPAVYDEAFADEVRAQLLRVDGVLVWVNPLQDGKNRNALDELLRYVAARGPWISAHPDVILKMGAKEVLYRTKHLGWGADTHFYASTKDLRASLPSRLKEGKARVLKQNRGNDGQGVWKVQTVAADNSAICATDASKDATAEKMSLDTFFERCAPYFTQSGCMVDQPFQERIADGMIRCYMVGDQVIGFAHQYPKGLFPTEQVRPHGDKRMFPAEVEEFQHLRRKMESDWVPQMTDVLKIERASLPVIWDADFLYGPRDARGVDTFVLCEINVSSVFAIPDEAPAAIAQRVRKMLS